MTAERQCLDKIGAVGLVTVALLTACAIATEPSGPVKLEPLREVFAVGEALEVRLVNRSATTVGYNFCHSDLEQRTQNGWIERIRGFGAGESGVCFDNLSNLPPGEEAIFAQELPGELEKGLYRLRLQVQTAGELVTLYSSNFYVERR